MSKIKQLFSTKKRVAIVVICLILVIGIVGITIYKKSFNSYNPDAIMGEEVQALLLSMQDLSDSINVTGKVESQNVLAVTTELQASIETLNVSLGQRVNEGDVLCTFNADEVKEQINSLQNQISQGQRLEQFDRDIKNRELAEAQAAVNAAWAEVAPLRERYSELIKKLESYGFNIGSEEYKNTPEYKELYGDKENPDVEALVNRLGSANETLESASKTLQSLNDEITRTGLSTTDNSETQKTLNDLQRQLDKTSLVASQSGIVTQLNVSKGSIPQGTMMQIEDDQNLRISVSIREQDILNLKEGMKAVITSEAFPGEEFNGTVAQVINFASANSAAPSGDGMYGGGGSSSGYSAYIDLDPGTPLLLGMSVKVSITFKEMSEALCVPYDSILDDGDGITYVYRAVPTDTEKYKIERVEINTGESNDYYTEVISTDLMEGDYIISNPWMVMEGDEVEISISGGYDMTDEIYTEDTAVYTF